MRVPVYYKAHSPKRRGPKLRMPLKGSSENHLLGKCFLQVSLAGRQADSSMAQGQYAKSNFSYLRPETEGYLWHLSAYQSLWWPPGPLRITSTCYILPCPCYPSSPSPSHLPRLPPSRGSAGRSFSAQVRHWGMSRCPS